MLAIVVLGGYYFAWQFLTPLMRMLLAQAMLLALAAALAWPMIYSPSHAPADWWLIPRRMGNKWLEFLTDQRTLLLAVLSLPVIWWFSGRTMLQRLIRPAVIIAVTIAIGGLCWLIAFGFSRKGPTLLQWSPVWIPRYLGIIWPAFAVALCALVMRLPTPALRWIAVCILIGVNMTQAWGRMFAGSEPRVDLIVADVVAGDKVDDAIAHRQSPAVRLRTYVEHTERGYGPETAHPSGGTVFNRAGKYYASIYTGYLYPARGPRQLLNAPVTDCLKSGQVHGYFSAASVASDARSVPLDKVIVWDHVLRPRESTAKDNVLVALGENWKKVGQDEIYPVRYHWNWSEILIWRRRTYDRIALERTSVEPARVATPPSTAPIAPSRPMPATTAPAIVAPANVLPATRPAVAPPPTQR